MFKKLFSIRMVIVSILLIAIMLISSVGVNAAGCSEWKLSQTGTAYCTNNTCPGGFKRKVRDDLYKRVCVRDNGTTYTQKKYKNVYVNCSCT